MWAAAGFSVAAFWAAYLLPNSIARAPAAYALARVSQPVVLLASCFNVGLRFYWVALLNATTYALIGLAIEMVRRKPSRAASVR
jgi:hypothetical protein